MFMETDKPNNLYDELIALKDSKLAQGNDYADITKEVKTLFEKYKGSPLGYDTMLLTFSAVSILQHMKDSPDTEKLEPDFYERGYNALKNIVDLSLVPEKMTPGFYHAMKPEEQEAIDKIPGEVDVINKISYQFATANTLSPFTMKVNKLVDIIENTDRYIG